MKSRQKRFFLQKRLYQSHLVRLLRRFGTIVHHDSLLMFEIVMHIITTRKQYIYVA